MRKTFILLAVILVSLSMAWADIDFLMENSGAGLGYDAANSTYTVKLKIRSNTGPQSIGHFNLRVLYNNNVLNFDMASSSFDDPLFSYDPFNMTPSYIGNPVEMSNIKCGFNVLFTQSFQMFAYSLDTTFIDVGTLVFNVVGSDDNIDLHWDQSGVQNQILTWESMAIPTNSFAGDINEIIGTPVTVTAPNGGETLYAGDMQQITWNAPALPTVDVEVSYDDMATWTLLADDIQNTGSYDWTVTDQYSSTCHVRVSGDFDGSSYSDVSDAAFAISVNAIEPANLTASVTNQVDVQLNWDAPASAYVTGYKVYRDNNMIHEITDPATTSYLDAGLSAGLYDYYVTAVYGAIESNTSNVANVEVEIPYAPTNLQGTVQNVTDIVLTWQMGTGPVRAQEQTIITSENSMFSQAVNVPVEISSQQTLYPDRSLLGYKIYKDNVMVHQINDPAILTWTDSGLSNGTYMYYVKAVFSSGDSPESNRIQMDIEGLYAPRNLTHTINGNDITVTWQTPLTGPTRSLLGYKVYRDGNVIHTFITADTLTYTDMNLANGSYSYTVSAMYSSGESPQTAAVVVDLEIAYAPRNLTAMVMNDNDVDLAWNTPAVNSVTRATRETAPTLSAAAVQESYSNGVDVITPQRLERTLTQFEIYRNDQLIHTTAGVTDTTYSDTTLANGSYNYYVKAVYTSGTSPESNTATVTIAVPYAPSNVATTVDTNDVTITWAAPPTNERNVTAYKVYRDDAEIHVTADATVLTYEDMDLMNGNYTYYVIAVYADGDSAPSASAMAGVHFAYAPMYLNYTTNNDTVNLYWSINDFVDTDSLQSFVIYRDNTEIGTVDYMSEADTMFIETGLAGGEYDYTVAAVYSFGTSDQCDPVSVIVEIVANGNNENAPVKTMLSGNYPNPFNPETAIHYSLKADSRVNITVYNIKGQKVRTLINDHQTSGDHEVIWNGKSDAGQDVGTGVYFYKMTTGNYTKINKMTLLK